MEAFGELLHAGWELKRSLADVSTAELDLAYASARAAGAIGGKLLGAGRAGFLLLTAPPQKHGAIRAALAGLREVPVRFTSRGTHITLLERADA